ncbi:unnamed protein product [Sphenostylis stenocarpa]|uniref:DYW domain-containing protein n=1 Tax=Sphenostylis stenocarpa TaxID=92480 RepID=A0AA86VAL0_9FABA|nr:unnamed protein product [Sphenostylis stenocarpa]
MIITKLALPITRRRSNQIRVPKFHQFASVSDLKNLLNKAAKVKNLKNATQIHSQIVTTNNTSLANINTLLLVYAKCGSLNHALLLFATTRRASTSVVTWTTLITQLSHFNKPFQALTSFNQMRTTGIYPNQFTFSAILPACAHPTLLSQGQQIHALLHKHAFHTDTFVATALLHMYATCGSMFFAEKVFVQMAHRNLVSWNSMIVGFVKNKLYGRAIGFFREVLSLDPDQVSFSSVLSACAGLVQLGFGKQVHGSIVKRGLVGLVYVKNSLVDMYCKCGLFEDATKLFRGAGDRDVVTWNVMIMGCVHSQNFEQTYTFFQDMIREGVEPDEASCSSLLHASASIAALAQGTLIHCHVLKTGHMKNARVSSSLVTMYGKCGSFFDAYGVFRETKDCNVVCWTAMITVCHQHGCANEAIELFEEMLKEGVVPEYITFVSVLSACSHTGKVDDGFKYFNSMANVHSIEPGLEHYACMVDLLGRVGRLEEARRFIESMPIEPDSSVWGALLGACGKHGNVEIGREVAERLLDLEPDNPGNYVLLANIYSRHGRLEEADEVRRLMGINGVRKETGCSWIDVKNRTFVFNVNDRSHSRTQEIYEMLQKLKELIKKRGYVAETQFATNIVEGSEEQSLWCHSEKLALAFGLLVLPPGSPVRIKKNLRTCGDCHTVMKFASEIFQREILVRDINRFHRFTKGSCSCRDYW